MESNQTCVCAFENELLDFTKPTDEAVNLILVIVNVIGKIYREIEQNASVSAYVYARCCDPPVPKTD